MILPSPLRYGLRLATVAVLFFVMHGHASAAQYYVSANGNDTNPGTITSAWKSIAKVNSAILNPGDQVYFRRGDTFSGQLLPQRSGTDTAFILYGAYGNGERPIIDGSAYNALYIDNPNIHHLRYENLDFANAPRSATALVYTHDMYFYNCIFRGSAIASGFAAGWGSGQDSHHITLDSCEFHSNYKNGVLIGSDTGANGPHDVLIKNCYSHHNGTDIYAHHGYYVKFGVTIENSVAAYNKSAGFKLNCESVFTSPYAPVLRDSETYGNATGIYVGHNRSLITGNYSHDNTNSNISMDSDGDDNTITYNTFENATNVAGNSDFSFPGDGVSGNVIRNNTFIQDRSVSPRYLIMVASGLLTNFLRNNTIDDNTYYTDGNPATRIIYDGNHSMYSWNQYRTIAGDADDSHSVFLTQLPTSPTPSPTPSPQSVPGDGTGDGTVDGRDYLIWLNAYTAGVAVSDGPRDGDYYPHPPTGIPDHVVDGRDFTVWLNGYNRII